MSSRILCINCGLCVNRIARHIVVQQDKKVVSFIAEKISPRIITECDNICQACLDTIMTVDQIIQGEISSNEKLPASSHTELVGHTKVCLMCGRSILRRKSNLVLRSNPSELLQMIATVIANSIESQEITTTTRVCYSCWMKARRTALRMQGSEGTERIPVALPSTSTVKDSHVKEEHDTETSDQQPPAMDPLEIDDNVPEQRSNGLVEIAENVREQRSYAVVGIDEDVSEQRPDGVDIMMPSPSESSTSSEWTPGVAESTQNVPVRVSTIILENYRRSPNTARHCVFPHCSERKLHRISDDLRIRIISDHHFYLPVHTRVCADHLLSNSWHSLYNSPNSKAVFTAEQVEHVFSLVNFKRTNIDFNDPLNMDDHLFQYCLGFTKEEFSSLMDEVPQIEDMHRGVTGLVACLIKLRNNDSDERISNLMGVPRRTLELWMKNVREKLLEYIGPDNSFIESILSRRNIRNRNLLTPNVYP